MNLNAIKLFLGVHLWVLVFLLSFGYFGNVTAAESDPIWTWPAPELGHLTSPPSISQDGTIYIGTYAYTTPQGYALTAINPDGTKKWVFPTDSTDSDFTPSTVGSDGIIYYTAGSKLYAINPNGIQKWDFTSPAALTASALGQDGTIYVGSSGGLFYALNSADGTIKWSSSSVCGGSSPAIANGGTIYVYGCENNLHALDANGNLKWTFFVNAWESTPPTVGADGTIYAGGWQRLNAINPDGTKKWIAPLQGFTSGTAIAPDGTLYVATDIHEGKLYAINPDGTQKWIFSPQQQPNWFSHPAVGADGTIYVSGYGDKFYAINPDGTEKWTFVTVAWPLYSPALTAEGRLIAANVSTLYAFNLTSGGLATSPWPMLSHDPQHTGRQSTGTPPPPPPSTCSPLIATPYADNGSALGAYEAIITSSELSDDKTKVAFDVQGTKLELIGLPNRTLSFWASIDGIEYDPSVVTVETNVDTDDVVGAFFADLRLIAPGTHASFVAKFCKPGEVTLNVGFSREAITLTVANSLISIIPVVGIPSAISITTIAEFTNRLNSIPLYYSSINHISAAISALSQKNYTAVRREVAAAGRDLIKLAINKTQRTQLINAYGSLGIKVGVGMVVKAIIGAPVTLIKNFADLIALNIATGFGSQPITIKLVAP